MQQIISFLIKFKTALVFWGLFALAIALTINANTYHQHKWVSSTNFISAFFLSTKASVADYFYLKEENLKLMNENKKLRQLTLSQHNQLEPTDSLALENYQNLNENYQIINAKIIANSYRKINNFLLLEVLEDFELTADLAVISPQGIVGVIEDFNNQYARVISLLNPSISINAQLTKSKHFGSLVWDGKDPSVTNLIDVPRSAAVKIGDTVETGGNSLIFPENIPIGEVISFELDENRGYYNIQVKLYTDMTNLRNVYVVQLKDKEIIQELMIEDNE